jgi:ribonuclease HII
MAPLPPLQQIEDLALREDSAPKALALLKKLLQEDPRAGAKGLIAKFERRLALEEKETRRLETLGFYERQARGQGFQRIAGVDEAGRGPLAGPVVAAAVILSPDTAIRGLDDSKKLTAAKREELLPRIQGLALAVGVGSASAAEIDRVNIYRAAQLAMERAIGALSPPPDFLLTDAMPLPALSAIKQKPLVHGDALSVSIAAASIVAKVTRDRLMEDLHARYPAYAFLGHKGYGTEEHLRALESNGPCPEHRLTFGPVTQLVARRSEGGTLGFWSGRLRAAGSPKELEQVGQLIKRLASEQLPERELEGLRELYREKRSQFK